MTTPALTVTFPPGNTIHYLQDFTFRVGMPDDVVFTVVRVTERGVELRAPGYGMEPYGNGCINISFPAGHNAEIEQLTDKLDQSQSEADYLAGMVMERNATIERLRAAAIAVLEGDADGLERLRAALDT